MTLTTTGATGGHGLPPTPWRDVLRIGPRFVASALQFSDDGVLAELGEHAPGIFTTPPLPHVGRAVVVTDPDLIKPLYVAKSDVVDQVEGHRLAELAYGGQSLFLLDGQPHRRLRRILTPPFRGDWLERHRTTMAAVTDRAIDRLAEGEPFRALDVMHELTAEIIVRICMGIEDPERLAEWLPVMQAFAQIPTSTEVLIRAPFKPLGGLRFWPRFTRARDHADRLLYAEIARRRDSPDLDDADDVLAVLLRSRTEDGEALTDVEIRDQLVTLLLAGHETTATTAAWALERTVRHPEVLARLTEEALDGDGESYARAVATETLRLRPPLLGMVRVTAAAFELGGYVLPPGTWVLVIGRAIHRDPELYPDPDRFEPGRFLDSPPPQFGFIPFGWGPHRCLGMHFAMLELSVVMHTLLRRLESEHPTHDQSA